MLTLESGYAANTTLSSKESAEPGGWAALLPSPAAVSALPDIQHALGSLLGGLLV